MERQVLSAREAAGYLEALDDVLLLTHVRPDGDTIGCAAALCTTYTMPRRLCRCHRKESPYDKSRSVYPLRRFCPSGPRY